MPKKATAIIPVEEYKALLPKVSKGYLQRAAEQGLTILQAKEVADITENYKVSAHHLIKLKRDEELSNNDLLNILEVWDELKILSIKSLRSLYELCDRDGDIFEHVVSEFVITHVIGEADRRWGRDVSRNMARLIGCLKRHLDAGGTILDLEPAEIFG